MAHRPGTDHENEPLVISLGVTGELAPAQKADEGSVLFASSDGVVLRYSGLTAVDARGRILRSRMEVRDHEIRLIVEDHDAQYPLVVDPTWMEQQELTRKDLEPMIGSRARVSEVMTGKLGLTLAMVRRVRSGLGISADLLVGTGKARRRA